MLLNDIVIHQIKGKWKITSLWVTAYCISAKGETVSQGFWELKHTDLYLSQHLLWYYWLVGCTNCGYPLIQTKHWAFKNQCRMHTVAFLNAAWFLSLLTAKALTEHQHTANARVWGVSQVCAAQYCSADSQEQGAELFVQNRVPKTKLPLQQGSWQNHKKLCNHVSGNKWG